MRALPFDVLDLLDQGRIAIRGAVRFDFGTGIYGFWSGTAPIEIAGLTYVPGGIIDIAPATGTFGLDAVGLEITLSAAPDEGLTPEILASIEAEDYHQRPVLVMDLYIHPDTRALLLVEPVWRGTVDTVEHAGGEGASLVMRCESRALDNARTGYRLRSNADQQLVAPGDRFFEHAETAGRQEIFWGRKKPK